jgi:hypothetical protein
MNNLSKAPYARILNNNHQCGHYILIKKGNMGRKINETV